MEIDYRDIRIYAECVRIIYQHRRASLLSVIIVSFVPLMVGLQQDILWETLSSTVLLWIFVICNYLACRRFHRLQLSDEDTAKWGMLFYFEHCLLALFLVAIFFYFSCNGVPGALFYLIIVSLGFSAGSVSAFHQLKWAPPLFMICALLPQILYYFLQNYQSNHVVAVILLIVLVFLSVVSLEQHKNWIDTLALRFELEAAKKEAEKIARIDWLTGLYNRRAFYEMAPILLKNAHRYKRKIAVVMMDIDFFKMINDTYGHAVGDAVLVRVAEIIKKQIRGSDMSGRLGGEEFAILFPDTDIEGASVIIERLRKNIQSMQFSQYDFDFTVTSSFGLVVSSASSSSLDELLQKADAALYDAKNKGRNRIEIIEC